MKNTIIGDVLDAELVDNLVKRVDVIFHLAAQINVDYGNLNPQETTEINTIGTLNVLEACRKYKRTLVYASSSEIYGSSQEQFMDESHPTDAQSVYAASKLAGDRLCKAYFETYGTDVRILRNFNTFGEYQRNDSYGGVIAIFTDLALKGKSPIIFGNGEQERDYMWIDDAIWAYDIIWKKGKAGDVMNAGTGKTVKIKDLAMMIHKYTGCPAPEFTAARPGEVRRLCAGINKARSLGFEPKTDFEKNLIQYVNWRKHESTPSN